MGQTVSRERAVEILRGEIASELESLPVLEFLSLITRFGVKRAAGLLARLAIGEMRPLAGVPAYGLMPLTGRERGEVADALEALISRPDCATVSRTSAT